MEQRKDKYLGFRIAYPDYMQVLEVTNRLGVSITDFILSLLLPAINKTSINQVEKTEPVKESIIENKIDNTESILEEKEADIIPLKLMLRNDDDIIEALKIKAKTYHQKLKNL